MPYSSGAFAQRTPIDPVRSEVGGFTGWEDKGGDRLESLVGRGVDPLVEPVQDADGFEVVAGCGDHPRATAEAAQTHNTLPTIGSRGGGFVTVAPRDCWRRDGPVRRSSAERYVRPMIVEPVRKMPCGVLHRHP